MFDWLMELAKPGPDTKVLDVGVTNDWRSDSNFFEKLYPYPGNITAVGMEDCAFLETEFPGLKFVQSDGKQLPFPDDSFDLCVSFAVLEHVGSSDQQKVFVDELFRVSKKVCLTTPNRWYPLEFHTMLPFAHWLPGDQFRKIAKMIGKEFLAREENLNLLDSASVQALLPAGAKVTSRYYRLLGPVSNLFFYVEA